MVKSKIMKLCVMFAVILFSSLNLSCSNNGVQEKGYFFNLEESYRLGMLNQEDLLEIANYHNNDLEYFNPLNKEMQTKIKKTRLAEMDDDKATIKDINITKYYGVYNDNYVVIVSDNFHPMDSVKRTDNVANVEFNYSNSNEILLMREDSISDEEKIKFEYVKSFLLKEYPLSTINDVFFKNNYGVYNNAHVLIISNNYYYHFDVITQETILSYVFEYTSGNGALVFYADKFYTLKDAYKANILSEDSLRELHKQFPTPSGNGMEVNGNPII